MEAKILQRIAATSNAIVFPTNDYEKAKAIRDKVEEQVAKCSARMKKYPRGAMGLVPDNVKFKAPYQKDLAAMRSAMATLRQVNTLMVKHYKKQMAAERNQRFARLNNNV